MNSFLKKIVLITLIVFLIYSLSRNILDYQKKISFFEGYKEELIKEREKNKKLKSDILKSQDYYSIEKNIRQKLNVIRPKEIAIILPKPSPTPTPSPKIKKSPPQQWLELFW